MISYQLINRTLPASSKLDMKSLNGTVGTLLYWDTRVDGSQNLKELLKLFEKNAQVTGVLVLEQNKLVGLIPRELVYEKLGRPFGVELFFKTSTKEFYEMLGISTLVLPADISVDDAVKKALMRDQQSLYEPIVVEHPEGYRIVSMYTLLMAQQTMLQDLYSEVHYLSTKDPLTMINNRRGFSESVNQQLAAIRQFELEYAVLVIDIDHFKNVNDRYGHLVGDEVIKSVAQQIFTHIRENDVLGRFGGEEFVIFSKDIPKELALELAERLRKNIASFFHTVNGFQIRVTISIGVSHSKGANSTIDRLFTEADQALYAAKNTGRNKVIEWKENLGQPQKRNRIFKEVKNAPDNQSENILDQTLHGLLHMLYLRDYETEAHTLRVSSLALALARKVGIRKEHYDGIRIGALLHDVGKIAIPDKILFKHGKLTQAEWAIMQKHPAHAYDLMSPISYFQHALDIPYCHHEHWNGKGYPRGLRGTEIPLSARIFTIVDVWDALTSDRPYRAAWKENDVKDYLVKQTGILFDPSLTHLFLESLEKPLV